MDRMHARKATALRGAKRAAKDYPKRSCIADLFDAFCCAARLARWTSSRYDEIAFCSLACQTRALLVVADAQQQEASTNGCMEIETDYDSKVDTQAQTKGANRIPGPTDVLETQSFANRPKPTKPSRPPLHSRHSVAVVNNLLSSSASPIEHPIMSSLRSDIFSIASVKRPLPSRVPSTSTSTGAPLNLHSGAPLNGTSPSAIPIPSSPSFFRTPLIPHGGEGEVPTSAEALYRQHYPKFASRRHLRDQSPNKFSPRMSDSQSTSTISDLQLLTPPSSIRPLLVLPELRNDHPASDQAINPPPPTPSEALKQATAPLAPDVHMAAPDLPLVEPPLTTPLLRQTPERRSAPRRSLEMSPNVSQEQPSHLRSAGRSHTIASPNILRPPLQSSGSASGRRSDASVAGVNSLGLEIQHLERTDTPKSASSTPDIDVKENLEPMNDTALSPPNRAKSSNPVSPPKMRARIISMHTAPVAGRHEMQGKDGWSSVEASRYTLGPREASYIVRKLSEEQKIRQLKERAAAREEAMESRGRSRARKRAGSWGNSLAITQSLK